MLLTVQMVAWSGEHVVLWHRQTEWSVHSTIMASTPIASIDYVDGECAIFRCLREFQRASSNRVGRLLTRTPF